MRSTERLIYLLRSVNATALTNDADRGYGVGDHIAGLCHEAADQLEKFNEAIKVRQAEIEEAIFGEGHHPGDHGC